MLNLKLEQNKDKVTSLLLKLGIDCNEALKKTLEGKLHFNLKKDLTKE